MNFQKQFTRNFSFKVAENLEASEGKKMNFQKKKKRFTRNFLFKETERDKFYSNSKETGRDGWKKKHNNNKE